MKDLVSLNKQVKVLVWAEPISMTCGFPRLTEIVEAYGHRIAPAVLYLFINKKFNYAKCLFKDNTGVCILAKKLDKGKFKIKLDSKVITVAEFSKVIRG